VTNGLGNFDVPIAEWNVMMMLMWHRHMLDMLQNQEDHVWDRDARFQSELRGSVIGFYGYGGIARETARLARTMGLQRWALTRDGTAKKRDLVYCVEGTGDPDGVLCDRIFGPNQKEEFLSQVDYLVIAIPITPATEGSIGADELKMLKPSAVIINPARAGLIEEKVLLQCLTEQWIRGLSLDVHYAYPLPPDHPLWSTPNVILTPHISGSAASTHFLTRVYDIFAKNIERFISNKPLLNQLTPAQLRGE
jgi:phosphoglycerate dehydrogenase-like enzyme